MEGEKLSYTKVRKGDLNGSTDLFEFCKVNQLLISIKISY